MNNKLVQIYAWSTMKKKYGEDLKGHINKYPYFVREMEEALPEDRIIKVTEDPESASYIWKGWAIEDWMIKKVIQKGE